VNVLHSRLRARLLLTLPSGEEIDSQASYHSGEHLNLTSSR
jgi:hypothetical protein